MQRAGVWLELPNAGRRACKLRAMTDPAKIASWTTKWKLREEYVLSRNRDGSLDDTTLLLRPRKEGLKLSFFLSGSDAEAKRRTFLDEIVAFARNVRTLDLFGGVRLWDWELDLLRDYPTPRPLLYPEIWSFGQLLMIIDREYFVQYSHFKEQ